MHNVYRILFVRFHAAQKDTVTDHSAYGVSIIYIYSILINKAKPAAVKGQYLKSVTLTSTMGPGVKINPMKLA